MNLNLLLGIIGWHKQLTNQKGALSHSGNKVATIFWNQQAAPSDFFDRIETVRMVILWYFFKSSNTDLDNESTCLLLFGKVGDVNT